MGTSLTGLTPATTYDALIKVGDNGPIDGTLKTLSDGLGNDLPMQASSTGINFTGTTSGLVSGVSGAIQFSNGSAFASDASNLFWDDTNNRLGIGTTTPLGILHLKSTAATTRMVMDGDAGQSKIITYRTAGLQRFGLYVNNTAESGSNVGSDFAIRAYNDAGTLLNTPVFIKRSTGNVGIGTTNPFALLTVGGQSSFYSVQSAGTGSEFFYSDIHPDITAGANSQIVSLLRLRDRGFANTGGFTGTQRLSLIMENVGGSQFPFQLFSESGALRIGHSSVATPTALVHLKGSGSTSATTSLLIENSSGTQTFKVDDSGSVQIGLTSFITWTFNSNSLTSSSYAFFLSSLGSIISTGGSGGVFGNDNGGKVADSGISTPQVASAVLEVSSTTKGFLPPRMTTTQRNAIATPATGLQVFDSTMNATCEYNGTAWRVLSAGAQSVAASTATTTVDMSSGNVQNITLTASTTLTLSSATVGTYIMKLIQGGSGSYTVTWPGTVIWSGGTAPTLTTTVGKVDIVTLVFDGTNFYGTYSLNY
jgi:hypothetical protein